ncbi:MAG TPA: EF-P lysine aminoacylase EpmA [Pontiella sp.]|nr:EF-P lysine aminoacylase EpmA [Pontiella sp.]
MPSDIWQQRDALMRSIRAFFHEHDFTEVDTPIRLQTPCMELHIDAEASGDRFLRTSPEMFHKKLLAAGYERIFELGKCFRCGEMGPLHNPEYTMLEWYRAHADYMAVLDDAKQLINSVWHGADFVWQVLAVSEVFEEFAGWNPAGNFDEDRFDLDLVDKVEPALKEMKGAVVLKDYPVEAAALSRCKPDNPLLAERWELYIDGIELANAYSELTDPAEQQRRFEECGRKRRALGRATYGIDREFIEAIGRMPPSGGVALGVDRLLMVMTGRTSLDQVLPFR